VKTTKLDSTTATIIDIALHDFVIAHDYRLLTAFTHNGSFDLHPLSNQRLHF